MTDFDPDALPPPTRAYASSKHTITQEDIDARQARDAETYRKRTVGAIGLLVPRNHPKVKWASWNVGWERECVLNRNNPEFLAMMRGQVRHFGIAA